MTDDELQDRTWAIVATVADGRYEDVDALLVDLDEDNLGHVVTGLAGLAVGFLMPRGTRWQDTGRRSRVADTLRAELLRRAVAYGPPDDAA
ncbi:hypothetical protein ACWGI8_00820 [Streptomyces sp. NPDC054841]